MQQTIDLLSPTPETRVSLAALDRALVFAFTAGDTNGAFEAALNRAQCCTSTFSPKCFSGDLFLIEFAQKCLRLPAIGNDLTPNHKYQLNTLCHPPKDGATVLFRQSIFKELLNTPELLQNFQNLYLSMVELRALLAAADFSARLDQVQRRVDILGKFRGVVEALIRGFGRGSTTQVLGRLGAFGERVAASEGYKNLCQLLEYEQHSETVDLRLRLGSDGSLRSFELLGHRGNDLNIFYQSRLGRFWQRLVMLLRGQKFTEREVLVRLLDQVLDEVKQDMIQLFQLLGDMEFYLCGLQFAELAQHGGLKTCFPSFGDATRLKGLFNPFLVADGMRVKSCDVGAGSSDIVVITGPNSGGKTRLLQSLALCHLLGHAGMPVPAAEAQLVRTRGMFVSLVDDFSADQREGRLGMELLRIRRLFEGINVGDLVVLDELCSGTNPSEGEEIFQLVLELLSELTLQVWLTTHFLQFAASLEAARTPVQLRFLQVELDQTLAPTFQFVPGVAPTSLAGQTAERLGVTRLELGQLVSEALERSQTANRLTGKNEYASMRLNAESALPEEHETAPSPQSQPSRLE